MANSIRIILALVTVCVVIAGANAQNAVSEAGREAPPTMVACMSACEQTQMACLQGPAQISPERRTMKDFNTVLACNRAEEVCDHRCRKKK